MATANDLNISQPGFVAFDGVATFTGRTLLAGPGIDITNGTGISGDPTISLTGGEEAIDSIAVQTGISPIIPTTGGLVTINGATVAAGTNPIRTDGTGPNTLAVEVQISQAIAATDATKIGLAVFDSAAFDVDASGFVQLNGGGIASTSFTVDANTAPGTNPVVPTASGGVTIEAAAVAAHSVPIETRSRAANTFKVEVQEAAAVAATDATKSGISHFNSAQFSVDANGFVSTSGTGIANTITGDSGGALSPTAGNWNIFGLSGSKTSGSGSTLTVKSPPYADSTAATLTVNSGTFATAAGAYVLPAAPAVGDLVEVVCITTGIVVTANTGQKIQLGTDVTSLAGTFTNSAKGDILIMRYRATDAIWYCTSSNGVWVSA